MPSHLQLSGYDVIRRVVKSHRGQKMHVVVAGNIGVGKTSLVKRLLEDFAGEEFSEVIDDNPFISKFYKNPKRWAFPFQVSMLNRRYRTQKKIVKQSHFCVQDRCLWEDPVFVGALHERNEMDEAEFTAYMDLFDNMQEDLTPPDVIIYLKAPPEACLERIKMRGRDFEQEIPLEYLECLDRHYDQQMSALSKKHFKVVKVNWETFGN